MKKNIIEKGCGFAPPEFFAKYFNEKIFAVQVRIFCPALGWAKGMLMQKPSIIKIQLPCSMIKVPKTRATDCSHDAYLLVKNAFPNAASKAIDNSLKGKRITKTALSKTNPLCPQVRTLLNFQGIGFIDIDAYERQFYDDEGKHLCRLRNDSSTVSYC